MVEANVDANFVELLQHELVLIVAYWDTVLVAYLPAYWDIDLVQLVVVTQTENFHHTYSDTFVVVAQDAIQSHVGSRAVVVDILAPTYKGLVEFVVAQDTMQIHDGSMFVVGFPFDFLAPTYKGPVEFGDAVEEAVVAVEFVAAVEEAVAGNAAAVEEAVDYNCFLKKRADTDVVVDIQ